MTEKPLKWGNREDYPFRCVTCNAPADALTKTGYMCIACMKARDRRIIDEQS
jgi:hypothetical protein